jgi:hypothetical protein
MPYYLKLILEAFLGRSTKTCSVIGLWLVSVFGHSKNRWKTIDGGECVLGRGAHPAHRLNHVLMKGR